MLSFWLRELILSLSGRPAPGRRVGIRRQPKKTGHTKDSHSPPASGGDRLSAACLSTSSSSHVRTPIKGFVATAFKLQEHVRKLEVWGLDSSSGFRRDAEEGEEPTPEEIKDAAALLTLFPDVRDLSVSKPTFNHLSESLIFIIVSRSPTLSALPSEPTTGRATWSCFTTSTA